LAETPEATSREGAMRQAPAARGRMVEWLGVVALVLCAAGLFVASNDFSRYYHSDESKKAGFTADFVQDFKHPLLLLQATRLVNARVQAEDLQAVTRLGRSVSAMAAAGLVLLMYLLARPRLGVAAGFAVAAGVALSPIILIHAHYFKEDLLLTFFCYLSLLALARFLAEPTQHLALLLGLATGLAFSSHYKSLLLGVVYLLALLLVAPRPARAYVRLGLDAAAAAAVVFLIVNYPILWDPAGFLKGFLFEGEHALSGHGLSIRPLEHLFSFHLVNSLIPGMTLPLALAAVAASLWAAVNFDKLDRLERVLLLFIAVAYFVVELSPTKPFPDFQRYVIPAVPGLIYFFVKLLSRLAAAASAHKQLLLGLGALTLLGYPGYVSLNLLYDLNRDTREAVAAFVEQHPGNYVFESYTRDAWATVHDISGLAADAPGHEPDFYVASSFMYGRYFAGLNMQDQVPEVYDKAGRYARLFSGFHCVEIRPRFRSFAFSNPVLRIVDLRRPTGRASMCEVRFHGGAMD